MELNEFLLFAAASLMLNLTPGSDMLYVATRSTGQGIRAGILSALGVMAGCLVHVTAAVAGLSVIITSSAVAFSTIKYLGAAYLIYLGIRSFFSRTKRFAVDDKSRDSLKKIFIQGAITNILNPKVALFFLAFLPQFVRPDSSATTAHIAMLGAWFTISGTMVNMLVVVLFGKMGNWLGSNDWFLKWQHKVTGLLLFILGLKIALTRK
jgi:threonine/homoserine/homoserine lactone efflux protein